MPNIILICVYVYVFLFFFSFSSREFFLPLPPTPHICFSFSLQVLFWESGLLKLTPAVLGLGTAWWPGWQKPFLALSWPPGREIGCPGARAGSGRRGQLGRHSLMLLWECGVEISFLSSSRAGWTKGVEATHQSSLVSRSPGESFYRRIWNSQPHSKVNSGRSPPGCWKQWKSGHVCLASLQRMLWLCK